MKALLQILILCIFVLFISSCTQGNIFVNESIIDRFIREIDTISMEEPEQEVIFTITAAEGDEISLIEGFIDYDSIRFSEPFNEDGYWKTEKGDAGRYLVDVVMTANESKINRKVLVIVEKAEKEEEIINETEKIDEKEVDEIDESGDEAYIEDEITSDERVPPVINVAGLFYVFENETLIFPFEYWHPEGKDVKLEMWGMPEDAKLKNGYFHFTPGFDFVDKSWIARVAQAVGIKLPCWRVINMRAVAESNGMKAEENIRIVVFGRNRAPVAVEPKPIVVSELDVVEIKPEITDPDGDFVFYSVKSWPWDSWYQTKVSDAGKYTVKVFYTDGISSDYLYQELFINKTNLPPEVLNIRDLRVREGDLLRYELRIIDPNNDPVGLHITDSAGYPVRVRNNTILFKPDFNVSSIEENTIIPVLLTASDGKLKSTYEFSIEVINVNRAPVILNFSPEDRAVVEVLKPLRLSVNATDLDRDELTYTWRIPFMKKIETNSSYIDVAFTSIGRKKVSVDVCDYAECTRHEWLVAVYKRVAR